MQDQIEKLERRMERLERLIIGDENDPGINNKLNIVIGEQQKHAKKNDNMNRLIFGSLVTLMVTIAGTAAGIFLMKGH